MSKSRVKKYLLLFIALAWVDPHMAQVDEAKRLLQDRQWEGALELFQKAVQLDPKNGEAHYYLAQLYGRSGEEERTIHHFREALRLLPGEEMIRSEYGKRLIDWRYLEEAERVFGRLVQDNPGESLYWIQWGMALYESGKPVKALSNYQQGIKLNSRSGQNYYLAGVAARSIGQFEQAKDLFAEGLSVEPEHVELNYQMGDLLLELGYLEESLDFLEKLERSHIRGTHSRGVLLFRLGQLSEAEQFLRYAVKVDPMHTQAHYQLGLLYTRIKKQDLAKSFFRRFQKLEEQDRQRSKVKETKAIVNKPHGG